MEKYFNQYVERCLKESLSKSKITQKQLSELTGIQQHNISDYKNGKVMPSASRFMMIIILTGYFETMMEEKPLLITARKNERMLHSDALGLSDSIVSEGTHSARQAFANTELTILDHG